MAKEKTDKKSSKPEETELKEEEEDPVVTELRKMSLVKKKPKKSEDKAQTEKITSEEKQKKKKTKKASSKSKKEDQDKNIPEVEKEPEDSDGEPSDADEVDTDEDEEELFVPEISSVNPKKKLSADDFNAKYESNVRADGEEVHLYTYCPMCEEHIFIKYNKSLIENARSYPVHICWVHGNPFHGLLVRIDKNFVSRGERIVHLEFDEKLTQYYG